MRSHTMRYPTPPHTYQFDATLGSDTATGAADRPLQTIAKANALVLRPRDRVLFNRGSAWSGTALVITASGEAGRPIVYSAYGTGALPIITGPNTASESILASGKHHFEFRNLDAVGSALSNYAINVEQSHDVVISACVARNSGAWFGLNISDDGTGQVYNIVIENCTAHDNYASGIVVQHMNDSGPGPAGPRNIIVRGNTSYDNGNDSDSDHGIYLRDVVGGIVERNVAYSNIGSGFKFSTNTGVIVNANDSYGNANGFAMDGVYEHASTCRYTNNMLYDNTGVGVVFMNAGGLITGGTFAHNTLLNNVLGGMYFWYEVADWTFKNNLTWNDKNVTAEAWDGYALRLGSTTGILSNNIWTHNLERFISARDGTDQKVNQWDGSDYLLAAWKALPDAPEANSIETDARFVGVVYTTVDADSADGQTVLNVASTVGFNVGDKILVGYLTARQDNPSAVLTVASIQSGVSLTLDTNLYYTHTAAQGDVVQSLIYTNSHLQAASPCIAAGDPTVGVLTDYDSVVRGAEVDIGAYEYLA